MGMSPDDFYSQLPQLNGTVPAPMQFGPQNQLAAGQPPVQPVARPVAPPQRPMTAAQGAQAAPRPAAPVQQEDPLISWAREDAKAKMAELPGLENTAKQQAQASMEEQSSFAQYLKDNPPAKKFVFDEVQPQAHDFVSKGTPWLMILTAIGGKMGKISGLGMLKAQAGLLKGINEGNKEAFDTAYKQWKDHYQMAVNEYQNANEVYVANMKWRAGMAGAEQASAAAAADVVGLNRQAIKDDAALINTNEKTLAALKEHAAKLEQLKEGNDIRYEALSARVDKAQSGERATHEDRYSKAAATHNNMTVAKSQLTEMVGLIDKIARNHPDLVSPTKGIADILNKYTKDLDVQRFNALQKRAVLGSLGTDLPGQRLNMWIEKFESGTQAELWTQPVGQIKAAAQELLRSADARDRTAQGVMSISEREYQRAGGDVPLRDIYGFTEADETVAKPATTSGTAPNIDDLLKKYGPK